MPANPPVMAIVDDDALMVNTYEMLFKHLKLAIAFIATNGPSALESIKSSIPKPTIILIDYRMPTMSGIELATEVKKLEPGIKIIFCSGDEDIREEALRGGGDAFLRKPTRVNEIRECIISLSSPEGSG